MTRSIHCEKCGWKPMHPEDVLTGWTRRIVKIRANKPEGHGVTVNGRHHALASLVCDRCGEPIADGSPCNAITMWRPEHEGTPLTWENHYGEIIK